MSNRLITPPSGSVSTPDSPLVFLAGPVQGAADYQTPLALDIVRANSTAFVASPRRLTMDGSFDHTTQIDWEKRHLFRASDLGVLAFWFAAQDPTIPYENGRAYAQTSRIELGRVMGWRDFADPLPRIAIGIDPDYTPNGGGSEKYFLSLADEHNIPVHSSIDELKAQILDELDQLA